VILRVDRQGIDGNRATGNGTHARGGAVHAAKQQRMLLLDGGFL